MIDDETKRSILDKILTSNEFKSSPINKKLLTHLVEVSIKKETPNEYTIASDVFCKNSGFNPNEDTIVRVSIHNLRKKLETFYYKEGKKAKAKIEIPKGQYEVRFIKVAPKKIRDLLLSPNFLLSSIIGTLIVIIMISQVRIRSLKKHIGASTQIANHHIWKGFFEKGLPKLIVLGDDFFFFENVNNEEIIIRKHNINSKEELEEFKQSEKNNSVREKTPYAFVPMTSIKPLLSLFPLLKPEMKISIQYSSKLESTDLLENDMVFFGSFRNLYILNQAIKNRIHSYKIGIGTNSLTLNLPDSLLTVSLNGYPEIEHSDYCFVTKRPGPNNNTIILFISFFESGMIGAINYMTKTETLKELDSIFVNKYGSCPKYFDILFKTTGFSRTAFTTSIAYVNKVNPDDINW